MEMIRVWDDNLLCYVNRQIPIKDPWLPFENFAKELAMWSSGIASMLAVAQGIVCCYAV